MPAMCTALVTGSSRSTGSFVYERFLKTAFRFFGLSAITDCHIVSLSDVAEADCYSQKTLQRSRTMRKHLVSSRTSSPTRNSLVFIIEASRYSDLPKRAMFEGHRLGRRRFESLSLSEKRA